MDWNFSAFRSPSLVDLHIHILPSLDDGAQSMRDSLAMADIAVRSGVRIMVVTPHANQTRRFENYATPRMQQVFEAFCREVRRAGLPLRVLPGMEIYASRDVVERIRRHELCPLAGTDYYLVEFPFTCPASEIEWLLQRMLRHGYRPIIAHPERYHCIQRDPQQLARWQEMGCAAQLNRGSVQGQFGSVCGETARYLIDRDWVDLFGSDAHGVHRRTPEMASIREYLTKHKGREAAQRLLVDNPIALLRNQTLYSTTKTGS